MAERLRRWLTHNLLFKFIALVIAVLLWFIFAMTEDPTEAFSVTATVRVENLEEFREQNHYITLDGEENLETLEVEVWMRARRSVSEQLQARSVSSYLDVYVDVYELSEISANRLMIHYDIIDKNLQEDIRFNEVRNKSYFEAQVDDTVTKEVDVIYEITGQSATDYIYLSDDNDILVTPETITLTGPQEQLDKVDYGKVTVRLVGEKANVSKRSSIVLYGADDNVVTFSRDIISLSSAEASVFIPIYMVKTVALEISLTDEVPKGYEYGKDISMTQDEITVYGQENVLNQISSIALPEISLAEQTHNFSQRYNLNEVLKDLYPHAEVRLAENSAQEVIVRFTVEAQEEREFELETANIRVYGLRNGWSYAFTDETLSLKLLGLRKNLNAFDLDDVTVTVRLDEGNYNVSGVQEVKVVVEGLGNLSLKDERLTTNITLQEIRETDESSEG